ncbi:F-box protein SKIP23-like [Gossypium australe]|uniref:F-box protein SKIP23-like n=1 Tax=Gossypium australe TaxID=47621 RepID=A0A5B6V8J9_9ROSI|nr:F-box protein SKIP23-like [Gossypium australe]
MADWSQLPQELLVLIAERLEARFDVVRFRSVCCSWRSYVPPKLYPFRPTYLRTLCGFSLSLSTRYTFYLLRSSRGDETEAPACWLVKIGEGSHGDKMQLLNPFSDSKLESLPRNFPKVLDLTNFQVIELGHQYVGLYTWFYEHPLDLIRYDDRKKLVLQQSSTNCDDFIIFASFRCLAFLRSGEKEWTVLEHVNDIQDIISFNEKFYAIDLNGKTRVIDQSLNVSFLPHVGSPRSRKFLVKSHDNLLAVEMLSHPGKGVGFRAFRMSEEDHKWDEMESLRDRILFLGFHGAVSAPASEFYWGKGNLIFYPGGLVDSPRDPNPEFRLFFVFDLETGTACPLENCPAYCNLFWPPPQWVTSSESVISLTEVISNSTHSISSATPENECMYPESGFVLSPTAITPKRATYPAGKEVGCEQPSPSSKCSFKFCCF